MRIKVEHIKGVELNKTLMMMETITGENDRQTRKGIPCYLHKYNRKFVILNLDRNLGKADPKVRYKKVLTSPQKVSVYL